MKEGSNKKVLWIVLFALITVVLCYMFVVLYFFCISPYNISSKMIVWPFMSDRTIGQMCLDATVEIDFKVRDEFDLVDAKVVGINVRKDGFVVAPYTKLKKLEDGQDIKIKTNFGKTYDGKLLYSDANYNISILKCENIDSDEKIVMPYVNVTKSDVISASEIIAVSSPLFEKNVWSGSVYDEGSFSVYNPIEVGGFDAVDFVLENCYSADLAADFAGGAIFDRGGTLLGFSYENMLEDGSFVIVPVGSVTTFLDEVVKGYQNGEVYENKLAQGFVGFDALELLCFMEHGSMTDSAGDGYFYFQGDWQPITSSIDRFYITQNSDAKAFYLFEDFVFGEGPESVTIEKDNLVTKIEVDRKSFEIVDKTDLLKAVYSARKGNRVKIFYQGVDEGAQEHSVTIVF